MNDKWSELLARSLDETLRSEEQQALQQALANSPELRREKKQLLQVRQLLKLTVPETDKAFVEKVMTKIRPAHFGAKVVTLFPRIAAACVLFFALTLGVLYTGTADWIDDEVVGVEELAPEEAYDYLSDELTLNY